jgi:hypothetical protein
VIYILFVLYRMKEYEEQQKFMEATRQATAAAIAAREAKEREEKAAREKALAAERANERREQTLMAACDSDAPSNEVPLPVLELAPPPEPELSMVTEEDLEPFIEPRKLTWAERRIMNFLDRLQTAEDLNARHPRRGDDNTQFFLPLTFSTDIHFNPFESTMDRQPKKILPPGTVVPVESEDTKYDIEEIAPVSTFADITRKVKHHKIAMERERLHLYDTSATEMSPRSWTSLSKTVAVDWEAYLATEQYNLLKKPEPEPEADDGEADFAEEMRRGMQRSRAASKSSKSSAHSGSLSKAKSMMGLLSMGEGDNEDSTVGPDAVTSSGADIPDSLIAEDYDTVKIVPLPLGKVLKNTVLPEKTHYYQVGIVDPNCVLTVELKGIHGLGEIYLAQSHVPSLTRHQMKAVDMAKSPEKVCRLVMHTKGYTGFVFLAVHSPVQGMRYQIWAACSGAEIGVSDSMNEVTKTIRSLTILANHDDEELHVNFPVLYNDAHNIAADEAKIRHTSILAQMNEAVERHEEAEAAIARAIDADAAGTALRGYAADGDMNDEDSHALSLDSLKKFKGIKDIVPDPDSEDEIDDEFDVLDRFVTKVGRRDLKAELKNAPGFPVNQHGITPFLHPEVFLQNGLETVQEFADYAVRPVTPTATTTPGSPLTGKTRPSTDPGDAIVATAAGAGHGRFVTTKDSARSVGSSGSSSEVSIPGYHAQGLTLDTLHAHNAAPASSNRNFYRKILMDRQNSTASVGRSPAARDRESIEWDRKERTKERKRRGDTGEKSDSGHSSRFSVGSLPIRAISALSMDPDDIPVTKDDGRDVRSGVYFTPLTNDTDFGHGFDTGLDNVIEETENDFAFKTARKGPSPVNNNYEDLVGGVQAALSLTGTASTGTNNAYADLFLSRSTTLPKLPRTQVAKAHGDVANTAPHKKLAASKSASAIVEASKGGLTLPALVPALQGQGQVAKKKPYDDGLLKQARQPVVVKYTIRKI